MSQHNATGTKRYRAKVANYGFRNQHWQQDDIVEVTPEEAKVIPHHFEELGQADDGSQDPEVVEGLAAQDKIDSLKDKRAKASYDVVKPPPAGGPATAIEKKPEDIRNEAEDRKAEEKENEERHEADRKKPKATRASVSQDDRAAMAEQQRAEEQQEAEKHKSKHR